MAMLRLYKSAGIDVHAVHCNFHLRAEESDRDEIFVKDLCDKLCVPLTVFHFDVKQYVFDHGVSVEMACRELRYDKFRELKARLEADRIAVAHNADDNIETLLLNLMRGSGIKGLRGMREDTGEIIRPLLGVYRKEILDYLDSINQDYIVDSTNLVSDYRRNFIRNKVIPLLEEEWPSAKKSISQTIGHLSQEEIVLDWAERNIMDQSSCRLSYSSLSSLPDKKWAIYRFISRFGGNKVQADEICRSLENENFQSGKTWIVPEGVISAERDMLEFVPTQKHSTHIECYKYRNSSEIMRRIKSADNSELWTSLSPDEINFRPPQTGDKIRGLGAKGSSLISKIMKDNKLSLQQKRQTIIAEEISTGHIIWASGLKRSALRLVDKDTEEVYLYKTTCHENSGK